MQFTYYVEALRDSASLYWDHYLMLSTQEMPMSPLLSPVTLIMTGSAYLLGIFEPESLIYIFASASYLLQVLCGYTMYLFLRSIGLKRLAAIVGGIGYGFNYFTITYGMPHGYYRLSAMALMPVVFIFFVRLFNDRKNTLYYLVLSGFLLGLTFVLNGDVKPTIYFIPVLVFLAYVEGYKVHGTARTSWLLFGVIVLGALITLAQFYPTLEALGEGVRSERTSYLPYRPLYPFNTLLGFSQNPFSMIIGFFFPHSFFEYYRYNPTLGISSINLPEQKFTFGIFLFLLSSAGVFYRTKRHLVWSISFLLFALYILGSSTPLWPIFGFISEHAHIRYPTRAAIVLYFFLSIYAAYGVDVLMGRGGRSGRVFYERWATIYIRYISAFILILFFGVIVTSLELHYDLFGVLWYTDRLTLFLSYLLALALIGTLITAGYISLKREDNGFSGTGKADIVIAMLMNLWVRMNGSIVRDFILYTALHSLASWISFRIALRVFKFWLIRQGTVGEGFSVVYFVEATLPFAVLIFTISYILVSFFLVRGFKVLRLGHYVLLFLLSFALFNILLALGGAESAIHLVHLGSLLVLAVIILFMAGFLKRFGSLDYKSWIERPYFVSYTAVAIFFLFLAVFLLFLFSGFMASHLLAPYLVMEAGGVKFQWEFLVVLIGLILFLLTIISGKRRSLAAFVLVISLGSYLFLYTDTTGILVPPTIKDDPSIVFKRDAELNPIYDEDRLDDFRIFIPRSVRREALSPELGFPKSHHTYCCRQYKDNLRFAFGQIVGPKALEKIRKSLRGDYSHPFWKLYNVGYIVDRFDAFPALLPEDPSSFKRLSALVIKIKDTQPLLSFMDSYEYADIDDFIDNLKGTYALDMEDKLYVHDNVQGGTKIEGHRPGREGGAGEEALIEINEFKSGALRATVSVDRAGFVVFSEVWAPSWTVYVDGVRKDVVRAYGMLQAVWVEAGTSEILFEYNIFQSWKMKGAFTLSSLALLFVIAVVGRRAVRGLDKPD